jgi:predicted transcriptional regulator
MKRERTQIIAEILAFCVKPRPKTHIMYNNNLSHAQLQSYLSLLNSRGLLTQNSKRYVITDKGQRLLVAFASLNGFLEDHASASSEMIEVTESFEEVEIVTIQ